MESLHKAFFLIERKLFDLRESSCQQKSYLWKSNGNVAIDGTKHTEIDRLHIKFNQQKIDWSKNNKT